MRILRPLCLVGVLLLGGASQVNAAETSHSTDQVVTIEGVTFMIPSGWSVQQDARSNGTILVGLKNGAATVNLYAKQGAAMNMKGMFMNSSDLIRDVTTERHGAYSWSVLQTRKTRTGVSPIFVTSFMTTKGGSVIYGYAKASTAAASEQAANSFIDSAS